MNISNTKSGKNQCNIKQNIPLTAYIKMENPAFKSMLQTRKRIMRKIKPSKKIK